jgi:activator of 2-hydroxyglutaryl-CoA dehydratase
MTGGVVAHNPYIVEMAGEMAGRPVVLPEFPQLAGAIGAALYAIDETERIGSGTNLTAGETDG